MGNRRRFLSSLGTGVVGTIVGRVRTSSSHPDTQTREQTDSESTGVDTEATDQAESQPEAEYRATVRVQFADCWAGSFTAHRAIGSSMALPLQTDGRTLDAYWGHWEGDEWVLNMPGALGDTMTLQPPITVCATIRGYDSTRESDRDILKRGSDREWPDDPLRVTMEINGERVRTATAQAEGDETGIFYDLHDWRSS